MTLCRCAVSDSGPRRDSLWIFSCRLSRFGLCVVRAKHAHLLRRGRGSSECAYWLKWMRAASHFTSSDTNLNTCGPGPLTGAALRPTSAPDNWAAHPCLLPCPLAALLWPPGTRRHARPNHL